MDKIICFGRNYLESTKKINEQQPELPVLFLKPPSVLRQITEWGDVLSARFPQDEQVVPECELVIEIGKNGDQLSKEQDLGFIRRVSIGLDMTLRKKQEILKKSGKPWTIAKVFPDAALLGPWLYVEQLQNWLSLPFGLRVKGVTVQQATATDMIFSPMYLLELASHCFPLCEGDIIFTGTPPGCISVSSGEKVEIFWGGKSYFVQW